LVTLEGCKATSAIAKKNFAMFPDLNIEIIQGEFGTTLPSVLAKAIEFDYVFIDGNHKLIPTLKYFEACAQKMSANGFMVIDDINWSAEMQQAWEKIKADKRVTISVDLFMVGIVFFNKGLSKENFTVRY
jgi:predicted O-methyltransferase YrrM